MFHAEQVSDRRVISYRWILFVIPETPGYLHYFRQRTTLQRGSRRLKGCFIQANARQAPKIPDIINYIVFIGLCVILYVVDNKYPVT